MDQIPCLGVSESTSLPIFFPYVTFMFICLINYIMPCKPLLILNSYSGFSCAFYISLIVNEKFIGLVYSYPFVYSLAYLKIVQKFV